MTQIHKTIFISYRRANQFMAQAVHQNLLANGYDVFIDYKSIGAGSFGDVILRQIEARAHFLIVMTPSALERCADPNDWLRREIEHAIAHHRNVVPLMFAGVQMGDVEKHLTPAMQVLPKYNALSVPEGYFDEAMARLRQNFLDIPFETIIHPAPPPDAAVVEDIKQEAAAAPISTEKQLTAEEYFEQGYEHGEAGRLDEAISAYSRAIALNPDYASAYHNRGNAYSDKGDYGQAIADYDQAIALNSDFALAYYNRGFAYSGKGDYDQAIADYDQAIALNPDDAFAYTNRGNAYRNKGDYDQAIADFTRSIELGNPELHLPYNNRGVAYENKGDYDAAIADYEAALRINPQFELARNNLANARRARG